MGLAFDWDVAVTVLAAKLGELGEALLPGSRGGGLPGMHPAQSQSSRACDQATCAKRHVVENFWEVLKCLRRVSTRYEKLKQSFEAFVHLAILVQHLRNQFQSAQFRRASSF